MSYAGIEKLRKAANDPLAAYRAKPPERDGVFQLGLFVGFMAGTAAACFGLLILSHFVAITLSR